MKKVIIDPVDFKKIVDFITTQSIPFFQAVELNEVLKSVQIVEIKQEDTLNEK
jgi:hypothetical protein